MEDIKAVILQKSAAAGIPPPRWLSWDNASNHSLPKATVERGGFQRVELSAHSPDIHKVVEHTFARFKPRLHGQLYARFAARGVAEPSMDEVRVELESALAWAARAETIAADQASLHITLGIIATEVGQQYVMPDGRHFDGSGGNWPPRGFR